jgi:hypothetical protein
MKTFGERHARPLFALALFIHLALLCVVFPVRQLAGDEVPHHVDYSYWLYNCTVMNRFLDESWQMWGYNPYISAGYPDGGVTEHQAHHGGRAWELAAHVLAPVSFPLGFKLYPFLCLLLGPLPVWWACRSMKLTAGRCDFAGVLSIFYWWSSSIYGIAVTNGTVGFQLAATGSFVIIAEFLSFCETRASVAALALLATSTLCLWLHPFTLMIVAVPVAVIYGCFFTRLRFRDHLSLAIVGCLAGLSTLPWSLPLFTVHYNSLVGRTYPFAQSTGLSGLTKAALGLSAPLYVAFPAYFGLRNWQWSGRAEITAAWSAAIVFLIGFTYFGSTVAGLRDLQPARYKDVCFLLMMPPAADGFKDAAAWFKNGRTPFAVRATVGALLCVSFLVSSGRFLKDALYEPLFKGMRIVVPMSPEGARLVDWLKANTTKDGRVLFEDSIRWEGDYNFVPGWLALESDREFIGGPYWDVSQQHEIFATYVEGWLFNRKIQTFDEADMRRHLDLYNVKWVVCASDESIRFFEAHPSLFDRKTIIAQLRVYSVERPASYFYQGTGSIEATFNRIRLSHLGGAEIILKYHWLPTLETSDGSRLRPVRLLDDPNPFIALSPRGDELVVYNGYGRRNQ